MVNVKIEHEDGDPRGEFMVKAFEAFLKFISTDYSEILADVHKEAKEEEGEGEFGRFQESMRSFFDSAHRWTDAGQEEVQPEEEAPEVVRVVCPEYGTTSHCDDCQHREPHEVAERCGQRCFSSSDDCVCVEFDNDLVIRDGNPCCEGCCPDCEEVSCPTEESDPDEGMVDQSDRGRRMRALKATLDEVRYQDERYLDTDSRMDVEDWQALIERYLAKVKYFDLMGERDKSMSAMRMVAALAVNSMANQGIFARKVN